MDLTVCSLSERREWDDMGGERCLGDRILEGLSSMFCLNGFFVYFLAPFLRHFYFVPGFLWANLALSLKLSGGAIMVEDVGS